MNSDGDAHARRRTLRGLHDAATTRHGRRAVEQRVPRTALVKATHLMHKL
jgi:hypothetical protein